MNDMEDSETAREAAQAEDELLIKLANAKAARDEYRDASPERRAAVQESLRRTAEAIAQIEKDQQLAGHFPDGEAMERARRILVGEMTLDEAHEELVQKYERMKAESPELFLAPEELTSDGVTPETVDDAIHALGARVAAGEMTGAEAAAEVRRLSNGGPLHPLQPDK